MRLPFVLARRFVAGETLENSLPVVHDLGSRGMSVALDLLGESVRDRAVAEAGRDAYVQLVGEVARERRTRSLDANVSIKLSMMGQKIDEDFCQENLRLLLDAARDEDVFVRLDMEGSDTTASTLALFEKVYPDYPDHVGIVLQAYLKRSGRDVERMCALNARVRICKGAYSEPPEVAYQDMDVIRERFMVYANKLIERSRFPGIATHDDRLISATKAFVEARDIDRDRFEFQMLYGIRPDTQQHIVQEGYNMRIYLPYGTEWLPYFSRRLRERRENLWFVLRHLLSR
jgi:proline dehydrogenase